MKSPAVPFGTFVATTIVGAGLLVGGLSLVDVKAPSLISPTYYRDQTSLFPAFDPSQRDVPKHIIVSGCQLLPYVFNRPGDDGQESITSDAARIENVANDVLRKRYLSVRDRFYSFDYPNTVIAEHTRLVSLALRSPSLRTLIYMNGPEGLDLILNDNNPQAILEAIAAAEEITRRAPAAAPYAARFIDWLKQLPGYQVAMERFGKGWRRKLSKELVVNDAEQVYFGITNLHDAPHELRRWLARTFGAPAGVLSRILSRLTNLPSIREDAWDHDIDAKREMAGDLAENMRKSVEAPLWNFDTHPVVKKNEEIYKTWFIMIAEAAKSKEVKLVIYTAPHASISVLNHEAYKTQYLDRVKLWLKGYDVSIIDNSVVPSLSSQAYISYCTNEECLAGGAWITDGYHLNIFGRIKQAELLVETMRKKGLLGGAR